MTIMRNRWVLGGLAASCLALAAITVVNAADKKAAGGDAKSSDRFTPPTEGGVAALAKFMTETQEELDQAREVQAKAPAGLQVAAKKILEIETDHNSEAYRLATEYLLPARIMGLAKASPEEQKKLIADMKQIFAAAPKLTVQQSRLAYTVASGLDQLDQTQAAIDAYDVFGKLFSKSDNPAIKKMGVSMEGSGRRLNLPGHEMEIEGVTTTGETFDWAKYRGKVVLIDFWATWCGPCLAELPNVKANYEKYHDRGFDIVGISLDKDRSALDAFLQKDKLPWVILNEKDAGWESAIAQKYGIMGIPTVILIDKEGKVVSLNARGPELGKLLGELLAAPAGEAKKTAKAGG